MHSAKLLLLIAIATIQVVAQRAEPTQIHFRRGASSAVVRGQLVGRQDMEYAIAAKAGQTVSLQLSATPAGSLELKILGAKEPQTLALEPAGPNLWKTTLPQDGNYQIWVVRRENSNPTSTYRLRVTIH